MAEPVGFEFNFRHHLTRRSLQFVEISANMRPGNHIEARSELFSCGQLVGKTILPTTTISTTISGLHAANIVNATSRVDDLFAAAAIHFLSRFIRTNTRNGLKKGAGRAE
jgi:hypothetical protein